MPPRQALRVYGALELAIGVLALILPFELGALDPLFTWAYADGTAGTSFAFVRLGASLVLLSLPAAAMGATFPIASRWFVQHASHSARDAVRCPPQTPWAPRLVLSSRGSCCCRSSASAAQHGSAWRSTRRRRGAPGCLPRARVPRLLRGKRDSPATRGEGIALTTTEERSAFRVAGATAHERTIFAAGATNAPHGNRWLAAAALGISGFASLTLQVVWTRLLAMVLGPTTYAFSTMVGIFIAGIAVGAAIGSRLAARTRQPVIGLALCLCTSAACAALSAALVDRALLSLAVFVAQPGVTFEQVLIHKRSSPWVWWRR